MLSAILSSFARIPFKIRNAILTPRNSNHPRAEVSTQFPSQITAPSPLAFSTHFTVSQKCLNPANSLKPLDFRHSHSNPPLPFE